MKIDQTTYLAHAKDFRQRTLVLHYTAQNFSKSIELLTGPDVSCHYLIPTLHTIDSTYPNKELIVYSLVNEAERAWHAGASRWKERANLNDTSIGIEIVNMATEDEFVPYPQEQVVLIIELCKNIIVRYPDMTPTQIVAHSDIAVGRKKDPGPLFPWKQLYDNGVGAWYDEDVVQKYIAQFKRDMPSLDQVLSKLHAYGYSPNEDPAALLKAFQMHFRPENYSGNLDVETAAIAYALCDKYGNHLPR